MKKHFYHLLLLFFALYSNNLQSQVNDIHLIKGHQNFNKIEDIIGMEQFKDKVIYVDIWGTLCGPCLFQFKYKDELQKHFENEPVEFLYLCSRYKNVNNDSIWRATINKYELSGYHVLISNEFYSNFWKSEIVAQIPEERKWGIPFYLIVDKSGKIAVVNAKGPSDKDKLYQQIESILIEKPL